MTDKLTKIALSGDDFDAFSKALDNPSEPNEALKSLFAGHIADLLERCGERIGGGEPNTFTDEIYDAVDRLRAFSAARDMVDRDASQVRDSSQQSSEMVERAARAICWADDCESGSCQNAGRCMAENLNATFFRDARAALGASHHSVLIKALREIQTLVDGTARNGIPEDRAKEYGRALSDIWAKADVVLAKIRGDS